jgi:hypothetical protein
MQKMDLDRTLCSLRRNAALLTILHLNHKHLNDRHAAELATALGQNTRVVILFMKDNDISSRGGEALGQAIAQHTTLRHVCLSYNRLGDDGALAIAEAFGPKSSSRIEVLKLSHNGITDRGAFALAKALAENKHLRKLELDDNEIGEQGLLAIAEAMKENKSLTSLDVRWNQAHDVLRVQHAFNDVLHYQNVTLCTLDLLSPDQQRNQELGSVEEETQFYLEWNRLGRTPFCSPTFTQQEWFQLLENLLAANQAHRILHAIVCERPDLICNCHNNGDGANGRKLFEGGSDS